MICVEYKKHLVSAKLTDPEWVSHGGMYFNPADKTYVGFVKEESDRDYYIPDGLKELTLEELQVRTMPLTAGIRESEEPDARVLTEEEKSEDIEKVFNIFSAL